MSDYFRVRPMDTTLLHACADGSRYAAEDAGVYAESGMGASGTSPRVWVEVRCTDGYAMAPLSIADAEALGVALVRLADDARRAMRSMHEAERR